MQLAEETSIANIQSDASERVERNRSHLSSATVISKQAAKRVFDFFAAIAGLIVFLPIFLLASIAIQIESRGPLFSRQVGRGFNNELIRPLKFRTTNESVVNSRVTSGLRLTRVGALLRSSGIEGLPQLVNVLRGEMSLVGPQLHASYLSKVLQERLSQLSRHKMKPGIIGWAQLNGPCGASAYSSKEIQQQIEHDLYYVENWSLLFDLKIILMTVLSRASCE